MMELPIKILVIDDEDDIAHSVSKSLSKLDGVAEVASSSSSELALEKMKNTNFSVVVSDVQMTGMNGFQLLSSIKQYHPSTRVILMSSYSNESVRKEAELLGSEQYLEKPFDLFELKALVSQIIHKV